MVRTRRTCAPRKLAPGPPTPEPTPQVTAPAIPDVPSTPTGPGAPAPAHMMFGRASKRTQRLVAAAAADVVGAKARGGVVLGCEEPRSPPQKKQRVVDVLSPQPTRSSPRRAEARLRDDPVAAVAERMILSYQPKELVGRDRERAQISDLLSTWLRETRAGCIYVSGLPGTGKTVTVSSVVRDLSPRQARVLLVNCTGLDDPTRIYEVLLDELGDKRRFANRREAKDALFQRACAPLSKKDRPVVIVLDELDFLTTRDQMTLYTLFEMPHLPDSRISLIGIANALDLTTRLPWLHTTRSTPHVVTFAPYDADTLTAIIQQRLISPVPSHDQQSPPLAPCSLDAAAIRLCSMKVAAGSGDARVALDTCRMAVLETARRRLPSAVPAVSTILEKHGGASTSLRAVQNLPVHQQLVMAVAYKRFHKPTARKIATLKELYNTFAVACAKAKLDALSFSQFADICRGSLVHHGLASIKDNKDHRKGSFSLKIAPLDIKDALRENRLFVELLN